MQQAIPYNTQIISWAIARAGYNTEEFAEKYPGIALQKWLQNEKQPTLRQLENFSKKVNMPFGYLFLKEPPKENIPFPFFRTGADIKQTVSPNVYDTIQIVQRRQDWLRDYLIETEEVKPLPFVGRYTSDTPVTTIVNDIRNTLKLSENWSTACATKDATRKFLVEKIEETGIVVVLNGVVENNTHRPIPADECRGFVLVDDYVPFIFVNISDAIAAQIFTLVHELVHVWIGVSAGFDLSNLLPADDPVERLCNAVAAEILVPESLFRIQYNREQNFSKLANYFKVSRLVIARRTLDLRLINLQEYLQYYKQQQEEWKQKKEADNAGGGNFYNTATGRVSKRFAGYIDKAVKNGQLMYRDAYRLTGLTSKTYPTFIENLS